MDAREKILKLMEEQAAKLEEELERIRGAIALIKGDTDNIKSVSSPKTQTRSVKWTSEIDEIFETKNHLTADAIVNILKEKGIEDAPTAKGRSAISTTLSRMVNISKKLTKTSDGRFIKVEDANVQE